MPYPGPPFSDSLARGFALHRRRFLAATSSVVAGSALLPRVSLARRRPVSLELTAAPLRATLSRGKPCTAWAYNGTLPGPTLELREGDDVEVLFRNRLDEPSTIHWHGLHIPFASDGSPFHPVPPGADFTYRFTIPRGSAGTYWYHPHPHHRTGHQIAHGLHGALIVRAPDDPLAHLPERVLVLWDNRFDADGRIELHPRETAPGRVDFENGREGDHHFVNGTLWPTFPIRSGEVQRWRIINASAARYYRLVLEGHTLLHVGSDGGLFERPVEVPELLLAPSERVEFQSAAPRHPAPRRPSRPSGTTATSRRPGPAPGPTPVRSPRCSMPAPPQWSPPRFRPRFGWCRRSMHRPPARHGCCRSPRE